MSKRTKIIAGVAVLVAFSIAASISMLRQNQSNTTQTQLPQETAPITAKPNASSSPQLAKGKYIPYTDTVIASSPGVKLLFFHASWCPQCREVEASINQKGIPDGVTIIKVDYDNADALRKKYEVTLQTTFVRINDNGDLVNKFVAYREPTIDSVIRELL